MMLHGQRGFFWSALCSGNKVERRFIFNVLFYFKSSYFLFEIAWSLHSLGKTSLKPGSPSCFLFLHKCFRPVVICWDETRWGASQRLIVRCALIVWGGLFFFFSPQLSTLSLHTALFAGLCGPRRPYSAAELCGSEVAHLGWDGGEGRRGSLLPLLQASTRARSILHSAKEPSVLLLLCVCAAWTGGLTSSRVLVPTQGGHRFDSRPQPELSQVFIAVLYRGRSWMAIWWKTTKNGIYFTWKLKSTPFKFRDGSGIIFRSAAVSSVLPPVAGS